MDCNVSYYSKPQDFTGGKTVREWLKDQPYEFQVDFGLQKLEEFLKAYGFDGRRI